MSKPIRVSCDIFVLKGHQLLLGIRKGKFGAGDWGLPGGHLEWGERLLAAAARELKEETGLVPEDLTFTTFTDEPREDEHYIHFAFITKKCTGTPLVMEPDRCEKWQFFDLDDLPQYLFKPHIQLIENLKNEVIYEAK